MIITKRLHRLISFILSLSLVFQTFSPVIIYAQEATQSADVPTETVTPTPTETPTVTPTQEVTPTVEPTLTPEPTETQSTAVLSPDSQSGPTEEVTPTPTPEPTPEPTPAITETSSLIAKVFTDKLDYAPTDTVTVNGTGFAPFQTYNLIISSFDYPGVSYFDTIFTDGAGNFTYQRTLDGNYRPNYSVEVRDAAGTVLASTTFTDAGTRVINSASLDGSPSTSALGGTSVVAALFVTTSGSGEDNDWESTSWSTDSGTVWNCKNHSDHTSSGTYSETFDITAPSTSGTYSVSFRAHKDDSCGALGVSATLVLNNGLVVISWPTSWTTPSQCSTDSSDESPSEVDLLGTTSNPAAGYSSDVNYQYFRERIEGNPGSIDDLHQYSWVVLFQTSTPQYQYLASVTGKGGDKVQLWSNTTNSPDSSGLDFSPLFNDPADSVVWEGNSSDYARVTNSGGVYFIDWAIPLSELSSRGITPDTTKYFATSTNANNYNKDHLNCYEAVSDVSITKTDSPDPITDGGTLTYILTSTNNGPDTATSVVVSDSLPSGYSIVSVTPSTGGVCSDIVGPDISCSFATLNNGSSATVTIVGTITGTGFVTNNASVASTTLDNNLSNNTASATTTINLATGDITFVKEVSGGTSVSSDWIFTISDGNGTAQSGDTKTYTVGSYIVTESSSVSADYTLASASGTCSLDQGVVTLNVTSQGGTCTITNTRNTGTVIVHKDVVGPDGEALTDTSSNFGVNLDSGSEQTLTDGGSVAFTNILTGNHTVSEPTIPSGYSLYSITNNGNITVATGENHVYIVNRQQSATLTVIKDVLNPDGNPVDDTHPFSVTVGSQTDSTFGEGDNATFTLDAGTYTVTEGPDGNYDFVSVSEDSDANTAGYQVHLNAGEQKTITVINKQKKAHITVIKDVIKSDLSSVSDSHTFYVTVDGAQKPFAEGSNAVFDVNPGGPYGAIEASDGNYTWVSQDGAVTIGSNDSGTINIVNKQKPGTISGYKYDATSGLGISGWIINLSGASTASTTTNASGFFTFTTLVTGPYTVTENQPAGWTPTGATSYNVTVNPGDIKTGNDFTNFQNITITACKQVDTDGSLETNNDRTNKSGWGITLSDGQVTDLRVTGENGCYTWTNKGPGNYIVTEETPTGWVNLTPATHDFGTAQSGRNLTFTFVNRISGSIKVIKDAKPNAAQDFTFTSPQFTTFKLDDDSTATLPNNKVFSDLGSNTYTITESSVSGWKLTGLTCTGGTANTNLDGRAVSITLDQPGEAVICTFTNTKYGSIAGRKYNDLNGDGTLDSGEPYLDDWTIKLFDSQMQELNSVVTGSGSLADGQYKFSSLLPGSYYICEVPQDNWVQTDPSSGQEYQGGHCRSRTVNAGQSLTGIHFGNRGYGTLIVKKDVVNDNGGSKSAADFTINVTGNGADPSSFDGSEDGISVTIYEGDYSVDEGAHDGYAKDLSADCEGTIAAGEIKTCTITNDDQPGTLIVKKVVINDNGGTLNAEDFSFTINDDESIDFEADGENSLTVDADTYNIIETDAPGYSTTYENCEEVKIANGETQTCTITNDDIAAPRLTLTKTNNAGGDKSPGGSVTYTLTLYVLDNDVTNAFVTDLLPKGFNYRSGSWLATLNGSPLIIDEPTYHSPGTWDLGPLPKDATVILTYIADIDANEDPGLYKDLAWAKANGNYGIVYAIGTDGNFVGTEVNINKSLQDTPSVNVIHENIVEGAVLGASTDLLPATGANTNILLLAILGLITGISLSGIGSYLKKKYE